MSAATGDQGDSGAIDGRFEITAVSIVTVLLAIGGAVLAVGLVVSARRVLSWVVACAVAAALIELIVGWLDKYINRALAIIAVLLGIGALTGVLMFGVIHDLDQEIHKLQAAAPQAAAHLEQSKRFGKTAREVHLTDRVTSAVDQLQSPSSGLAGQAVSSVGVYTVCVVLTIFFLSWGPHLLRSGVKQLAPDQQIRARLVSELAFSRARRYVTLALVQALVVGVIGYAIAQWNGLPAPAALAVGLVVVALIPNIGILMGSLPILLLSAGLSSSSDAMVTAAFFLALQIMSGLVFQPRIVEVSKLYVGPAIITIAFLAGYELYGIGGALYGAALFVFGVAALDAIEAVNSDAVIRSDKSPGAHE